MAYEVEAIAPITTPTDASIAQSPVMREERVVEPYRQRAALKSVPENGQPNTVEPSTQASEAPVVPAAESVSLSPQMAALARKEQAFRRQQQEFKAKEQALAAKEAEILELQGLKAKLAAKDYSEVEKLVPYNEYSQYLIDKGTQTTPEQEALKKLEAEVQSVKDAQKTDIEKRFEAEVSARREAATELVASSPEFPGIKKLKQEEAVVQHILDTWENDDIELSVEQAAKEVEQILKEQAKAWAAILEEEKPPVDEKKPLPPIRQGTRTLTNEMTVQGEVKPIRKSFQGMSDAERYAEARRRAEANLRTRG